MCSIFLTNKKNASFIEDHGLLKQRGPDGSKVVELNSFTIIHHLLSMTGEFTLQPVINDDIVCLFNGEIYNFLDKKEYRTDVYKVIDSYNELGEEFIHELNGEFAIVIMDISKDVIYLSTDIFGIKPLYYSIDQSEFGVCSYKEPLEEIGFKNIIRCPPNRMLRYSIKDASISVTGDVHVFDTNQYKKSYDDWTSAFLNAVKIRFDNTGHDIILPLSSGHDSGAISCALNLLNVDYTTFSFFGNEDRQILNERFKTCSGESNSVSMYIKDRLSNSERSYLQQLISTNCTMISYGPDLNYHNHNHLGVNDPGAQGLMYILDNVKKTNPNIRILASGQGGDEIMTNIQTYKFGTPNPKLFPKDLASIFPWENFFYGAQSSYLCKEESISGAYGIEGRYPFLDKNVVQEFLWLSHDLKNSLYKAPITNFLSENMYPHTSGNSKVGFNA